jgi:hypothetical protein
VLTVVIITQNMNDIEIKRASIGKVGFFFNDENEKTHKIGRLVSVTKNGNVEDEDQTYYDNFTPMKRADLLECIDLEFFS